MTDNLIDQAIKKLHEDLKAYEDRVEPEVRFVRTVTSWFKPPYDIWEYLDTSGTVYRASYNYIKTILGDYRYRARTKWVDEAGNAHPFSAFPDKAVKDEAYKRKNETSLAKSKTEVW